MKTYNMTREEAAARIKNHKIRHKMNEPRAIYISEALDMGIEALEHDPCDYVTAFKEDVLDAISKIGLFKTDTKEVQVVAECLRAVEALPPVAPQQKQTLREEPDPCDFCETIYPDADTKDIVFRRGKYSDFNKYIFITIDDEGKYYVNVDPGDPYELGYLCDVKFCPYCGRKLTERR